MSFLSCKQCGYSLKLTIFKCPNCGALRMIPIPWFVVGISLVIIIGIFIKSFHSSYENKLRYNTSLEYTLDNIIFGTVLMPDFTIKNLNNIPIKDIIIQCDEINSNGTLIDSMKSTITDIVPAKGTKIVQKLVMGNIASPSSIKCRIVSVKSS